MRSAKSIAFCQTSNFSKLNMFLSLNSQQPTLNLICSSFAPNAPFRNATVLDEVSEDDRRLEIPTQTQLQGSRRLGGLRHRAFGVPRGNVLRQIRRAPARQCTLARRIRGNPQRAPRVPVIGCNLLHLRERAHRARIRRAAREFSGALRAILVRYATFRICPREERRARGGTNRLSVCR